MNKLIRLSKSGIEYLDYAWNFYSGCHHQKMAVCPVDNCWAESIVKRFSGRYPNGFEPTYYPEAFLSPLYLKKPSIIGCAFMGDLFGDWVDPDMKIESMMSSGIASVSMSLKGWIFTTIRQCPQHKFVFLTKNPQNLVKWSPFPDNCWVGVTATDQIGYNRAIDGIEKIEASLKYFSFEPLLGRVKIHWSNFICGVKWVIIGAQTKPTVMPKIEWVREIVEAADKAGIPVFLKDNLKPLLRNSEGWTPALYVSARESDGSKEYLRQEMPEVIHE